MGRLFTSGDWSGTLVALSLIASDAMLHMAGKASAPFDEAIPIIVALYLGGHIAMKSASNGSSKPPPAE